MTLDSAAQADAAGRPLASAVSRWFVAYTRPALETLALQNLQQQGFDAYLPLYRRLKRADAGMTAVFEPMFPRYVFFRPSQASQSIAPAGSTRGVACIVSFGHEAATIGTYTVRAIRQFEQERNAADSAELSSLRPGHVVRFCHPAFIGLEGLVKTVSSRRVAVLLELMGRQQLVYVDHQQLKAA